MLTEPMKTEFEQAIAESLHAVETYHVAKEDIGNLVESLDAAVSGHTSGRLVVRADAELDAAGDEDLPLGLVRLLVHVSNAPDRQREVCALRLARSGYPIEVLSFANTRTSCPDLESLEYKMTEILRDARFGLKLKALMAEP